ncbi:MAG: arsenic resistance N-acetyltransferase ArsN2 [Cytophagaceae bacterium]|jgi:amino-acid N-acetyltransferase|nr:arsenic resistance N-acetyltransferase ArsN2 [Cytophagaceae bacterium]
MEAYKYVAALENDLPSIRMLLGKYHLPFEDIDAHLPHFIVVKYRDMVIGTIGMELLPPFGLLRSLAIDASFRRLGLASGLLEKQFAWARNMSLERLYLLTTTAEDFFQARGFTRIDRVHVPTSILHTKQFSSLCPSSSVVMVYAL